MLACLLAGSLVSGCTSTDLESTIAVDSDSTSYAEGTIDVAGANTPYQVALTLELESLDARQQVGVITVSVLDGLSRPAAGLVVSGQFHSLSSARTSALTDADGIATLRSPAFPAGEPLRFELDGVAAGDEVQKGPETSPSPATSEGPETSPDDSTCGPETSPCNLGGPETSPKPDDSDSSSESLAPPDQSSGPETSP